MSHIKKMLPRCCCLAMILGIAAAVVHADTLVDQPVYLQNTTSSTVFQTGCGGLFTFQYRQRSASTQIVVRIYDDTGTLMRTIGPVVQDTGFHEQKWDGKNDSDAIVSPGRYFYQIAASNAPLDSKPTAIKEPGIRVDAAPGIEDRGVYGSCVVQITDGRLRMYYSSFSSAPSIYISSAVSSDSGITWIKEGPRFQVSNTNGGGTPSSLSICPGADCIRLYYVNGTGTEIRSANSVDGLNFIDEGIRLTTGAPGSFDQSGVTYPNVVLLPDGRIRMYYDAYDGSHDRIMSAISNDELVFTKESGLRIDIGPVGAPDHNQSLSPSVRLLLDGTWEMIYGGNDGSGARLLRATSPDGLAWTKDTAVVYNHQGTDESFGAFLANTIPLSDGTRRIVYTATSSSFTYRIFSLKTGEGGSINVFNHLIDPLRLLDSTIQRSFVPDRAESFTIRYLVSVETTASIEVRIFNESGVLRRRLGPVTNDSGTHSQAWNGLTDTGVAADFGRYYYQIVGVGALLDSKPRFMVESGIRIDVANPDEAYRVQHASVIPLLDGRYRMYYSGITAGGRWRLFSAISSNGIAWTREGLRIDDPPGAVNAEVVFLPDGRFRLYYEHIAAGEEIVSATSMDGLNFTKDSGIRIPPGFGGTYDQIHSQTPRLAAVQCLFPDSFRLYYTGRAADNIERILSASSSDGLTWTSDPGIRIAPGNAGSPDASSVLAGDVQYLADGRLRMFYSGLNGSVETVMSAVSSGGLLWAKETVVLSPLPQYPNGLEEIGLLEMPDGTTRLYPTGANNSSNYQIISAFGSEVGSLTLLPDTTPKCDTPLRILNITSSESIALGSAILLEYLTGSKDSEPLVVRIFNESGNLVRNMGPFSEGTGRHAHEWDGKNDTGTLVGMGTYTYQIARNDAAFDTKPGYSEDSGVRVDGAGGNEPNALEPSVIQLSNGSFRMYYSARNNYPPGIYRILSAISTDGLVWTKEGVVLEGPNRGVVSPSVIQLPDGRFRLYCSAQDTSYFQIVSAISDDGRVFVREAGIRIPIGSPGSMDASLISGDKAASKICCLPDGLLRMYYVGFDAGGVSRILSAVSGDGLNWTKESGARIEPGPSGSVDHNQLVSGAVRHRLDGTSEMLYSGHDGAVWRLLLARSPDGLTWTKTSTVQIGPGGPFASLGAADADYVEEPDGTLRTYYYFVNNDAGGVLIGRILSATSSEVGNLQVVCRPSHEPLRLQDTTTQRTFAPSSGDTLAIRYLVEADTVEPIVIRIFNESGTLIRTLGPVMQETGTYSQVWDGRDSGGLLVGAGRYSYQIARSDAAFDTRPGYLRESGIRVDFGGIDKEHRAARSSTVRLPDGRLRMYYFGNGADNVDRILSSTSIDGITWIDDTGVRLSGFVTADDPRVTVIGCPNQQFRLYYADLSGSKFQILSAISIDGLNFISESGVRIPVGGSGSFDEVFTGTPFVSHLPGGTFRMYYTGRSNQTIDRILSAVSIDGFSWTKEPGIRIDEGPSGSLDAAQVLGPNVRRRPDGTWEMLYEGQGGNGIRRILRAVSADGLSFVKDPTPVLEPVPNSLEAQEVFSPDLFEQNDGTARLYYTGASGVGNAARIFSAIASEVGTVQVVHVCPREPLRLQNTTTQRTFAPSSGDTLTIRYLVEADTVEPVVVRIFNDHGDLAQTLGPVQQSTGMYSQVWDGRDSSGLPVGAGRYFYQIARSDASLDTRPGYLRDSGIRVDFGGVNKERSVARSSTIRLTDGRLRMYYNGTDAVGAYRILSATSMDGISWIDDPGVRFSGFQIAADPRIMVVACTNRQIRLYYDDIVGGKVQILSAISDDGLNFISELGVRVPVGGSGSLDENSTQTPFISELPDGRLRIYYGGRSAQNIDRILSAVSTNGLSWTKEPGIRIDEGASGFLDAGQVVGPSVRRRPDATWEMLYEAHSGNSIYRILRAVSADGLSFVKDTTPVLEPVPNSLEAQEVFSPDLFERNDGTFRLYYSGSSRAGARIFSATASEVGTLHVLPERPREPLRLQNATTQITFASSSGETLTIRYCVRAETTEPIVVRVFDETGALVRTLGPTVRATGVFEEVWDGRTGVGAFAPANRYFYQIARTDAAFDTRPDFTIEPGMRIAPLPPIEANSIRGAAPMRLPDGRLRLYYSARDVGGQARIFSAASVDGVVFTREGVRIETAGVSFEDPDIVRLPDGRLRLYYETTERGKFEIGSAISEDGLAFTRESGVRIPTSLNGSLDAGFVANPEVMRLTDLTWRMYYEGFGSDGRARILSAVSTDGVAWTAEAGVRVDHGPPGSPDELHVGGQGIAVLTCHDGTLRMYYGAVDAGDVQRTILTAVSTDGLVWTKEPGVKVGPTPTFPVGANIPKVSELPDGTLRLYFTGFRDRSTQFEIYSATASEVGTVEVAAASGDTTAPQVRIDFPRDSAVIRDTVEVRGRVFDYTNTSDTGTIRRYTLAVAPADQFPLNYTVLFTRNSPVESGVLGTLDLTSTSAGEAVMRLQAEDSSGNVSETRVSISIERALPDLAIRSENIILSDTNPKIGDIVNVTVVVENKGTADASNIEVALLSDGAQVGTAQIPFIPHATSSETVVFQVTATHDGLQILTVKVDPANRIAELSEIENNATQSLIVGQGFSGLILVDATVSPNIVVSGDPLTIFGIARYNPAYSVGGPVSGGIVEIFYQGLDAGDSRLDELRAAIFTGRTLSDGSFRLNIPTPVESGTYTIAVSATDRSARGLRTADFGVTTPTGPDLLVRIIFGTSRDNFGTPRDGQAADIAFETEPIIGSLVRCTGRIFNVGRASASDVEYRWLIDGVVQKFDTVPFIAGGSTSVQVFFDTTFTTADFHTITLDVDPNNRISDEFRENNNTGSRIFRIWRDAWDRLPNRRR